MSITRTLPGRTAVIAGIFGLTMLAAAAPGLPRSRPADVEVVLTDYKIQMSNVLEAGRTRLNIRNEGEVEHGFAIRTTGAQPRDVAALKSSLAPGASASLEANLTPGSYEVVDPLKDHKDRGMSLRLAVQNKLIP
ncbi:MAG TPA: hypothetical protein VD793_05305 [Gemmatimonadales bacterium]|nr:hypothetical protein [Gemmatimonadales bacterium]